MMRTSRIPLVCAGLVWACAARAVIIDSTNGAGNTAAPADDPGWSNVGSFNRGLNSAIYLGNDWVLTALHVLSNDRPTQVSFQGSWYGLDTNSWHRITNSTGTFADMAAVRVTNGPTLPAVVLRQSAIPDDAGLTMIGRGYNRAPTNTFWNSSWIRTNAVAAAYTGFLWASGQTMRWGQNVVNNGEKTEPGINPGYGGLTTVSFSVTFDAGAGANEAQAAIGDSGGAVFYKSGAQWQLVGMMYTIDEYDGQAAKDLYSAAYGNKTWSANLTQPEYYTQLAQMIPEPSTALSLVAGLAILGRIARRRRARE